MSEQVRSLNDMLARFQVGIADITATTSAQAASAKPPAAKAAARVERRGTNRPWTARAGGKAATHRAAPQKPSADSTRTTTPPRAAANGNGTLGTGDAGDSEWQEF